MSFPLPLPSEGRLLGDDLTNIRSEEGKLSLRSSHAEDSSTPLEALALGGNSTQQSFSSPGQQQQIILPDPLAFRYLEDDPTVAVIDRRRVLHGYELYVVEQWACTRQSPTIAIVTYTGDDSHRIMIGTLAIPQDARLWSTRLKTYMKAAYQEHARPQETDVGRIPVTNLSSFPSDLSVIPVPDGDMLCHRMLFFVNEGLKRMGCSGRSGLTLTDPTPATRTKFQQLYKIHERVPFKQAVIELIKLCQVALYIFDKLDHEYIDGLLCDVTEASAANWWTEVGAEHYNFEPTDGVLGPSTVAALLGMLMGARNRLHWYGAPVSKDVFDIENTQRGISYFQKQQKLEKTRRLDRQTLFRLYNVSAKAAASEGWRVQKAVKSTVTEFGGKRGEMVLDMVSGKDKGGLADIETLDLDRFVSLAYGERPKWLWHGKPRRTPAEHVDHEQSMMAVPSLSRSDTLGPMAKRIHPMPPDEEADVMDKEEGASLHSFVSPGAASGANENAGDRDALRKGVFKSVAGKMSDARSGLGRIKDAVGGGRRGHHSRPSASNKDENAESANEHPNSLAEVSQSSAMSSTPAFVGRAFTWKNKPDEYVAGLRREDSDTTFADPRSATLSPMETRTATVGTDIAPVPSSGASAMGYLDVDARDDATTRASSHVRSPPLGNDVQYSDAGPKLAQQQLFVSRRRSSGDLAPTPMPRPNEKRWARRLSFGDAEQAVLGWDEIVDVTDATGDLASLGARAEEARHLDRLIEDVIRNIEPWVEAKIGSVESLDERFARDKAELQALYERLNEASQRVRHKTEALLADERSSLTESVKEIEVLVARLEYEIDGLGQKVHDVEDGVLDFERQVVDVENRAEELKLQLETESWLHWLVRTMTGIGTGPNITRETG